MPQSKGTRGQSFNTFTWGMSPVMNTPLIAILAELNGTLLESVAAAQKEWADFVHRRIQEDVAVTRQLIGCSSLADMHEVYSHYLKTAFEQYHQQSEKVVQRGRSMAQHLAETVEDAGGKESPRARH
jgi:hypothetical protein